MPSVTHAESPMLSAGKKRRRDDNGEMQQPLYSIHDAKGLGFSLPQTHDDPFAHRDLDRLVFRSTSPNNKRPASNLNDVLQRKMRPLATAKRVRISDDSEKMEQDIADEYQHIHTLHNYSKSPASPHIRPQAVVRTTSSALLSPCHICHRKPTKKSDLDSFADCEGCGQRTCYVCIRQCQGWFSSSNAETTRQGPEEEGIESLSKSFTMHDADDLEQKPAGHVGSTIKSEQDSTGTVGWKARGHGSVICSRCCVERGSEGDVMCLGCLAGVEGA